MAEKDHNCSLHMREECGQCRYAVEQERDGWKASAELRQATCDQLAKLAEEWKRRAEDQDKAWMESCGVLREELTKVQQERDALAVMVGKVHGNVELAACWFEEHYPKETYDGRNIAATIRTFAPKLDLHQAAKIAEARKKLQEDARELATQAGYHERDDQGSYDSGLGNAIKDVRDRLAEIEKLESLKR